MLGELLQSVLLLRRLRVFVLQLSSEFSSKDGPVVLFEISRHLELARTFAALQRTFDLSLGPGRILVMLKRLKSVTDVLE